MNKAKVNFILLVLSIIGCTTNTPFSEIETNPAASDTTILTNTELPPTATETTIPSQEILKTAAPTNPNPTETQINTNERTSTLPVRNTTYKDYLEPDVIWNPIVSAIDMVYIPEGEFLMGASSKNPVAITDERPQRYIYLDGYWIDRTEVTNTKFAVFLNGMGNQEQVGRPWFDSISEYAHIQYDEGIWKPEPGYEHHPVVEVTWFGANSYCIWMNKRLPSEAEWEKGARGIDGRPYPWGDSIDCENANFKDCIGNTSPVGSYLDSASPYGLLDISGNAAEWVADWYDKASYKTAPTPNPTGPNEGRFKVVRGGSWLSPSAYLRVTYRERQRPDTSGYINGFRCVYTP